jgi:AcrR family transcriptional regulator
MTEAEMATKAGTVPAGAPVLDPTARVSKRPPADCPRRGRHLDESRDPEIMRAALELLAESGYDRLTMEAVAARAKAGKATLYRRWPSKAELVVDAVTCLKGPGHAMGGHDTGSLRGDLRASFLGVYKDLDEFRIGVISGLLTSLRRNPDLAKVFEERFVAQSRRALMQLFARARERGEVAAGHDIELLATVGPAILFHRLLLTGKPLTREFITRVIDEVIVPLAGNPLPGKAPAS